MTKPMFLALLISLLAAPAAMANFTFEPGFTPEQKKIVLSAIEETKKITADFAQPPKLTFYFHAEDIFVGAAADLMADKIIFSKTLFQHPPETVRAIIAHEYTHLVIVREFKLPNKSQSLYDQAKKADSQYDQHMIINPHTPYAEVLCDLVGVMISRNPKVYSQFLHDTHAYVLSVPELSKYAKKIFPDSPIELGSRDFSVSDKDPRWQLFQPTDGNYNRFNQMRSYLWHNGVKDLPTDQNAKYFSDVFRFVSALYATEAIERLSYHFKWPDIMKQLMHTMDVQIPKPITYGKQVCGGLFLSN